MGQIDKRIIELVIVALQTKQVSAWVDHYDAGEDDEKVIKVMLPMVAIAVLACVVGYYVKNKFFKDDEDKEEKEKSEQKKIEGQKFPNQPKANKPWLTAQGTVTRGAQPPVGPTGGYEFTLPGYQQATRGATEKRTHSEQSGKSGSSGYQSHMTGVHHVSEKRSSNYNRQQKDPQRKARSLESKPAQKSSEKKSEKRIKVDRSKSIKVTSRPSGHRSQQNRTNQSRSNGQRRERSTHRQNQSRSTGQSRGGHHVR